MPDWAKYKREERKKYPERIRLTTNKSRRKTGYHKRKSQRRREKQPERVAAWDAVHNAIMQGTLVRPKKCSACHMRRFIQAHHPDYSKPLEVAWLCQPCHRKVHGLSPALERMLSYKFVESLAIAEAK